MIVTVMTEVDGVTSNSTTLLVPIKHDKIVHHMTHFKSVVPELYKKCWFNCSRHRTKNEIKIIIMKPTSSEVPPGPLRYDGIIPVKWVDFLRFNREKININYGLSVWAWSVVDMSIVVNLLNAPK